MNWLRNHQLLKKEFALLSKLINLYLRISLCDTVKFIADNLS